MSAELTWRFVLLSAVFSADLAVFAELVRNELRDRSATAPSYRITPYGSRSNVEGASARAS